MGRAEVIDEAAVTAKYGIPGRAYADFATLRGDPSDGLPGVSGVGDKTAAALITRYGDLRGADGRPRRRRPRRCPPVRSSSSTRRRDYLAVAPAVVRVARDVPLPAYDDAFPPSAEGPGELVELSERWGLDSPLNRVLAALRGNDR